MRVHKKTILLAIKQHLQAHLPDALQSIVLFGSRAWGDALVSNSFVSISK